MKIRTGFAIIEFAPQSEFCNSLYNLKALRISNKFRRLFPTVELHKLQDMRYQKVGIIGLGLIGGSIAKKLKQKGRSIYTVKSKSPDLKKAKKFIDKMFPSLDALVQEIDLLIIATPLSAIIPIAKKVRANHPLLVLDVGSVKEKIVKEFAKLTHGTVEFLSTHPMAGTEKRGFDASDPDLFKNAPWIIVPHKKNKAKIKSLIRTFGAKPLTMQAKEHDKKIALISHLPMLLSKALWTFVQKKDPKGIEIAGPSFRSMTRLAHGNQELIDDIVKDNKTHLRDVWNQWIAFLGKNNCY